MNKEKKIRHIDLDTAWELQQGDLPIYEFRNNASFICNYLSKAVRPLRLVGNGSYNMIGVTLTSKESSIDSTFASI